ncbi:MAG TPA: PD-(D/E)XK nuclease family protein, partial [Methanoregulaceae archaeon]|nr:PD-(D/E)XK nuclease family protein [Methanoregulaceae archaeon]
MPDQSIISGLPGEKLDLFIQQFVAAAKDDPFGTWLILPTQRLVLFVTADLTEKKIPFLQSRICTLDGFCNIQFDEHRKTGRFLQKAEAKLLLALVLSDLADEVPLFAAHGRPSSATIDDLMTFMNVTLTRKVDFPGCLGDLASEKSRQLDRIITEYRARLVRQDLVDGDTLLPWTIDHLHALGSSPPSTVFIYGFHEPLPLEEDLITTIQEKAANVHVVISDGLDRNIFRSRVAAGEEPPFDPAVLRSQVTGLFTETAILEHGDFFRVQTFPTRFLELCAIAAEIRRLNAGRIPLSSIAVVLPDLRGDLGLVEEIFSDFSIPWNAAVGPRLSRAPVVRFLSAVANLSASGFEREDVVRVIASPFFRHAPVPGGTARLDAAEVDLVSRYARIDGPRPDWERQLAWLHSEMEDPEKARRYPGISIRTVERVQEGIATLSHDLAALSRRKPLRDNVRDFRTFLASWEIPHLHAAPDKEIDEHEARAFSTFCSRLDALSRAAWKEKDEPVNPAEFSRLVSAMGEEPDDGGRHDEDGVVLLGLRECPHMKFPVVFIGGLTEGIFPRLTTRLPFTNSLENARMGTRTLAEILREEQYFFIAALLSAEKAVYLSAPLADGEKILLTSAFFERVRMRAGECPWPDPGDFSLSQRTAASGAGCRIRSGEICDALPFIPGTLGIDDLAQRIDMEVSWRRGACDSSYDGILAEDAAICAALADQYGPDHVWSATGLETYAACPFSYFLQRVIGLAALPEVEPNLSPGDRGTVIHDILSAFYRQWRADGRTTVPLSSLAEATEMILRIAQDELATYPFESPIWDATRILMTGDRHSGPGYFERFLRCEAMEAESPLIPARFEFSFGMGADASDDPASVPEPVELVSPDGTQRLKIRGRIDRIDIADEGFLIYDYKSGRNHPSAKEIAEGIALQIPLYLLAFQQVTGSRGIGGGYYTIRRDVKRSIVLADDSAAGMLSMRVRASPDFAATIRHALDCAFQYLDGIRGGRFPLPPEERCPNSYCEFLRI